MSAVETRASGPAPHFVDLAIAMDRTLRTFEEGLRPILQRYGAEHMGLSCVLFLLALGDREVVLGDIVRENGYLRSNASYVVKALAREGFLVRTRGEQDARVALVMATGRGRELAQAIRGWSDSSNAAAVAGAAKVVLGFQSELARRPIE